MNTFKKVIAPQNSPSNFTDGNEYDVEIIKLSEYGFYTTFRILDDNGRGLICHLENCSFLNGNNWIIKE